jgi:CRP/FNR family transcriptional regulator, polysaccharide utilization system transcription regulator
MEKEKNTCMKCVERDHSLLNELSYDELKVLNKNRYVVSYESSETICKEGTKSLGLICLNKGKVKISRTGINGTEQILNLKKPMDFIGFRTLMNGGTYLSSATALEDVSVCVIDKYDFFKVIANNDQLAFKIMRYFAHELDEMDKRLVNLTQKHIRARMADALIMINKIYGTKSGTGVLNVSLKRSDLAALAHTSIANAIKLLSSFTKENLIEVHRRDIKIKDLKGLKDLSVLCF